jgi:hypothetical protein
VILPFVTFSSFPAINLSMRIETILFINDRVQLNTRAASSVMIISHVKVSFGTFVKFYVSIVQILDK